MGEVYLARDHKLLRDVAIKTLPEAFATDPERMARFRHEARVLASLNHPNIAAIYGLEEFLGVQFLVMELVEGETLAERIASAAPISIEEALSLCGQVAEGLEAAHLKGVTHRDVKPANVKVTPEGRVKVLDFGLAKAIFGGGTTQDLSQALTVTEFGTEYGRVLGTPSYMSPEQARGKTVDKRTDIWAFGCLLYELLTRKKAFPGETTSDTLAAILGRPPAWDVLPAATPTRIRGLLQDCLQKDVGLRLQDIRGAIVAMKEAGADPRPRLLAKRVVAALAVSAVLAGAVALPGVRRPLIDLVSRSRVQQEKHLAVLPFTNVGGNPVDQVFCDGVVESLTTRIPFW
jgi:serine/threonine-protein kinase